MIIHSNGQITPGYLHIEGITLEAGKEENLVWIWMGIGEADDRTNEGQTSWVNGENYAAGISNKNRAMGSSNNQSL